RRGDGRAAHRLRRAEDRLRPGAVRGLPPSGGNAQIHCPSKRVLTMDVMVRPLLLKPQWMNGLSERLLVSHYVNHYGGAVRRLNAIRARLAALDWARTPAFESNGLKREELIAAGSVILH